MKSESRLATDLVISPFEASAKDILEVAKCAEEAGFDGIWMLDHFSGAVANRRWSHETFTVLGAIAAVTTKINLGSLVANMMNRNPVILASAFSTLQGLSNGRATLGLGTGAPTGTMFAVEQEMIGKELETGEKRYRRLIETIQLLQKIWSGDRNFSGEFVSFEGLEGVIEPSSNLRIVLGANGSKMVNVASQYADGVNIRVGPSIDRLLNEAISLAPNKDFEISIHESLDLDHPYGGAVENWKKLGVHRRACTVSAPFDLERISKIGVRLQEQ